MSDEEWFWMDGNSVRGPNSSDQLIELSRRSEVSSETSAWRLGSEEWRPLGELIPAIRVIPPPLPVQQTSVPSSDRSSEPSREHEVSDPAWSDNAPHPWRRLGARMFDNTFNGGLTIFTVAFLISLLDTKLYEVIFTEIGSNRAIDAIFTVLAAIPLNALLIGTTGTTLGKWIFGVKILDQNRVTIGFIPALYREGAVWAKGMGLAIPIVSLVFIWSAYRQLSSTGATSWDANSKYIAVHRREGMTQNIATAIGIAAIAAMIVGLRAL